MKRALTAGRRLLHPPKWVLLSAPPLCFSVLAYVMSAGQNRSAPAYALYALSAYCLAIWIIPLPRLFRRARSAVLQLVTRTAFGERCLHDLAFRASVGICAGAAVNLAYAGFRMVVGLRYASVWFLSIAAYDLVLGLLRLSLILSRRRRADELRCYRRTAWLLFLLIVPMGGMILLMVLTDSGYSYPGYVIYVSALYTFCMMGLSVRNLVKYRRPGSPILSAAKILNVIAALMSVLGLQTAMIAQFSAERDGFRRLMNALTGGFVFVGVILIASYMLLHGSTPRKQVKHVEPFRE